jgi:hypothetical protein
MKRHFLFVLLSLIALLHCGDSASELERQEVGSTSSALCAADWSPTWHQGSGANEWWVEYEIGGGTVASAFLEIAGVRNVQLAPHYGKWAASAGTRIPTGTQVVLHATTSGGQNAQTVPFGFLTQTSPSSDPCTDAGGGGGGGGACFASTFTQGSANEWWVEYFITGDVASAYFQVVGGQRITLSAGYGKWRGKPTAQIPSGASVFVHAEDTSGRVAETEVFRYLVDTSPPRSRAAAAGRRTPEAEAEAEAARPARSIRRGTRDPARTSGGSNTRSPDRYAPHRSRFPADRP